MVGSMRWRCSGTERFDMAGINSSTWALTLSQWYGRLLDGMLTVAGVLLLVMTLMIGADVLLRNVGAGGVPPSNELSEDCLYLITLLAAPGLLRQGQHIRVDIVLRALPLRIGWLMEWAGDIVGLACCAVFVWYGASVTAASYFDGALSIKTLVLPEWWLLAPMPAAFALLAVEFVFRMHRLAAAERRPREDAVSAS
jgi:TRAP-type transport system small permease protein